MADVLYYYGEDTNVTPLFGDKAPPVPAGYNFDYVNADAVVNLLSVVDGQLATPSGMRYCLLQGRLCPVSVRAAWTGACAAGLCGSGVGDKG